MNHKSVYSTMTHTIVQSAHTVDMTLLKRCNDNIGPYCECKYYPYLKTRVEFENALGCASAKGIGAETPQRSEELQRIAR